MKTYNEFWVNEYNIGDIIGIARSWTGRNELVGRVIVIHAHMLVVDFLNHEFHRASGRVTKADILRRDDDSDIKQYAIDLLRVKV